MLSVVTWVPGLLLFGLQVGLAGGWWFVANWTLGAGIVAGFLIWLLDPRAWSRWPVPHT